MITIMYYIITLHYITLNGDRITNEKTTEPTTTTIMTAKNDNSDNYDKYQWREHRSWEVR